MLKYARFCMVKETLLGVVVLGGAVSTMLGGIAALVVFAPSALMAADLRSKTILEYERASNPNDGTDVFVRNNNSQKVAVTVRKTTPADRGESTQEYSVLAGARQFVGCTGLPNRAIFTITAVSGK